MRGRIPKSEKVKKLAGDPGKRGNVIPFNANKSGGSKPQTPGAGGSDEAFVVGELVKPDYLDEYASAEWDRIVESLAQILSPASAGMVLIACESYSDMRHADDVIKNEGRTYITVSKDGGEMHRLRPEVGMKERARTAYHRALSELGASPVAHTRVKKLPEPQQTELPGIGQFLG